MDIMDDIALAFVAWVIFVVAASGIALMVLMIRDSSGYQDRWKRALARRFEGTPLAFVVVRLGIPLSGYLQLSRADDLARQLRRCRRCDFRQECLASLRSDRFRGPIFQCPNAQDIAQLAQAA